MKRERIVRASWIDDEKNIVVPKKRVLESIWNKKTAPSDDVSAFGDADIFWQV